jgi:molybdopterin molybdotransferase
VHKARLTNLRSLDTARTLLARAVSSLSPREVSLEQAAGLILAEDVCSDSPLPRENVSAMDGFAIRNADLRGSPLPVTREIAAGQSGGHLEAGSAARIFTGAEVPSGADTVVPQELAEFDSDGCVILEPLPTGSHIRRQGELYAVGAILANKGDRLTPARIALLASGGAATVSAVPRCRFAIVLTGSELVDANETPTSGQIRDSNGPMLRALIQDGGLGDAITIRTADDPADMRSAFEKAFASADIVLTSGGVSVGDYDYVPDLIEEFGGKILFHGVSMKPGKPLLAARVGDSWLLGLPGNPLSVLIGWRLFALPLIHALHGLTQAFSEQPLAAVCDDTVVNRGNRTLLHPSTVAMTDTGTVKLLPLPWKGSHDLFTGSRANALLRLEPGESLKSGDDARYYPLERLNLNIQDTTFASQDDT